MCQTTENWFAFVAAQALQAWFILFSNNLYGDEDTKLTLLYVHIEKKVFDTLQYFLTLFIINVTSYVCILYIVIIVTFSAIIGFTLGNLFNLIF